MGRLGSWTLLVVLANQLSLYVVLAFAFGLGGDGPVSAYTYGWSFMQMPYAVVVVSVLGALTPQLAGSVDRRQTTPVSRERLRFGLRQSLVIIIPCTLVLIVLAQPIVAILLNHLNAAHTHRGRHRARGARGRPARLHRLPALRARTAVDAARARGLLPLRRCRTPSPSRSASRSGVTRIAGLTASVSIAYSAAAVVALGALARHRVNITTGIWSVHVRRSLAGLARRRGRHGPGLRRTDLDARGALVLRARGSFAAGRTRRLRPSSSCCCSATLRATARKVQGWTEFKGEPWLESASSPTARATFPRSIARRARHRRRLADHPLRRRGVHRPRRPLAGRVLGEVQGQQDAARDGGASPGAFQAAYERAKARRLRRRRRAHACRRCSRRPTSPRSLGAEAVAGMIDVRVVDTLSGLDGARDCW